MFRAALFSTALIASLVISNQAQNAEACGTNKGLQRPANVSRSVKSKNPSKILVVGERDGALLKGLSDAKHKIEYVSNVKSAKHSHYDLIIADESDLVAVRARFGNSSILKKKSTISTTVAYAETMLERTSVASSRGSRPVDTSDIRSPVAAGAEREQRKRIESGGTESYVAVSSPVEKVSASTSGSRELRSATGESPEPAKVQTELDGKWTRSLQFGSNRVELDERSKRKLSANVAWLKVHANASLVIEGHSDSVGDEVYNLELSERRANVARKYMVEFGIAEGRITVVSKGESEPAFVPSTSGKNRRIVLIKK